MKTNNKVEPGSVWAAKGYERTRIVRAVRKISSKRVCTRKVVRRDDGTAENVMTYRDVPVWLVQLISKPTAKGYCDAHVREDTLLRTYRPVEPA